MRKLPLVPNFETPESQEEKDFWRVHDIDQYLYGRGRIYQKNLNRIVSIRFSIEDYMSLKKLAFKKKLGVTTFVRQLVLDFLARHS